MTAILEALKRAEDALADLRALILAGDGPKAAPEPPTRLLTAQDYETAAEALGVPVATIEAVAEVESGRAGGFGPDGRPIILYEPHIFSRLTNHRFDETHGGVSYRKWKTKPYPPTQAERWAQMEYAMKLPEAREAALQSASYGRFQIMGFNFKVCGFASIDAFVDAMKRSEGDQLMAFVGFIKANNLARHLAAGDFVAFAGGYNGPGQAETYGAKIAAAVARRT